MEKIKKIFTFVAVIVFITVALFRFMYSDIKHIEDTNCKDNYKLQILKS